MHRILYIHGILLDIFGHFSPSGSNEWRRCVTDLAALARTCRTFKEPALDVLWEELDDMSLLTWCLPEARRTGVNGSRSSSRPLSEAGWDNLRGYTRRVRRIHIPLRALELFDSTPIRAALTLALSTDPLFPNLRSIIWGELKTFPVAHVAVPSLVSLQLGSLSLVRASLPLSAEIFEVVGERCPDVKQFRLHNILPGSLDAAISRQLCRWKNLQCVDCRQVTMSIDAILHLCSVTTLTHLSFMLSAELDNRIASFGFLGVFSKLAILEIESTDLKSITNFFSCIQLPVVKDLSVLISGYIPRRDFRAYWAIVQKVCSSNILAHLSLSGSGRRIEEIGLAEWLTLDDVLPYRDFGRLNKMCINLTWSVSLSDADLLDLVSTSPQLEELAINRDWGWKMGDVGGITLNGFTQLLRQCPSLESIALVIDTWTFTEIPDTLDISFPPRHGELWIDFLDSHISPPLVASLATVFLELPLIPCTFTGDVFGWDIEERRTAQTLWGSVMSEMMEGL